MNFGVLNKADSRRCSSITHFYCCVVQTAKTRPNTTGKEVDCARVRGCEGWWELGEHSQGGAVPAPPQVSPLP